MAKLPKLGKTIVEQKNGKISEVPKRLHGQSVTSVRTVKEGPISRLFNR